MKAANIAPLDILQRYSVNEACLYLRTSRATLYKLIATGELPVIKERKRTYISGRSIADRSSIAAAA